MTILRQKSNFYLDAGKSLVKNSWYAPSIHCFFYSCLQLIKCAIRENEDITFEELEKRIKAQNDSTHTYLIRIIGNEIYRFDPDVYRDFNNQINELKLLRVESDYKNEMITIDHSIQAERYSDFIRGKLINLFNV